MTTAMNSRASSSASTKSSRIVSESTKWRRSVVVRMSSRMMRQSSSV